MAFRPATRLALVVAALCLSTAACAGTTALHSPRLAPPKTQSVLSLRSAGQPQRLRGGFMNMGGVKSKLVYSFSKEGSDGDASMKAFLGGKGANLAEMSKLGLSVPPGFTISTEVCESYISHGNKLPPGAWEEVQAALKKVEKHMGMKLGDASAPLLVSVRSGAAVSMPGMMDTVLNLGLNDEVVEGLAKITNERFAYDSYRRLLDMYGDVVMGVHHSHFEEALEELKEKKGVYNDNELSAADLKELVASYKEVYKREGKEFPTKPEQQLLGAIDAVFASWNSDRAVAYRNINHITGLLGTAVTVQSMVFGNLGATSGTGVLFSRNPSTGENKLYGEYLIDAQGEDVVAGIRTPDPISTLAEVMPDAYKELLENVEKLESHYQDMQDIEFTIQDKKLYMLQCRNGKRTGPSAVKIAVDMFKEGLINKDQAIGMVDASHLDQLLHPQFASEDAYKDRVIGKGLPASPGAAVGQIVFTPEEAEAFKAQGGAAILVRAETSPEDVSGMHAAEGILTNRGGMTSHAAVVARGWGKTCVSGCQELVVNDRDKTCELGGKTYSTGDWLSLNGNTGEVIEGREALAPPTISGDLGTFMGWVDERRKVKVFTNADTPEDAAEARRNGAQGIGLVRTEHMFFASDERLMAVREMVMADSEAQRKKALGKLLPYQRSDFEGIFKAMDGCPVTIRLLDPPLHEFLPNGEMKDVCSMMASELGLSVAAVSDKIAKLSEVNPMLGLRGCRLGIVHPEISEMQARAIMEAALAVKRAGHNPIPDIMVPLVGSVKELEHQAGLVRRVAEEVFAEVGDRVDFRVGTMIEIPRAALMAGDIAKVADFFSFGTNDLTQMTFGFSRDDVGSFLPAYLTGDIIPKDPFQVLDRDGVGQLIEMAVKNGRAANPSLKCGICGEHGGDPTSIDFVCGVGLDYVSCSPFRVPIARLAAAQSVIKAEKDKASQ
eukprot:CAMPEP_0174930390 /NCGR_PEP_ID=MMETSP1355-20121228/31135_1 /TAXON_ID=464990 /ORGANISM="Hemiselmis tepida, Strain CCMP443" /LENGTH=947 /DNA_ID=CAMNT_0016176681 /DNA_START=131 /DNA_END=2971 /DNA_ORIENTATION=-